MRRFADMDGPGCRQSAAEIVQLVAACAEARQQPPGWRSRLLRLPRRELRSASHGSVQVRVCGTLYSRTASPSSPHHTAVVGGHQALQDRLSIIPIRFMSGTAYTWPTLQSSWRSADADMRPACCRAWVR